MKLCNASFCDFVVWSKNQGILVQRLFPDARFIIRALEEVENFIKRGILPDFQNLWVTGIPNHEYLLDLLKTYHCVLLCHYPCQPVLLPCRYVLLCQYPVVLLLCRHVLLHHYLCHPIVPLWCHCVLLYHPVLYCHVPPHLCSLLTPCHCFLPYRQLCHHIQADQHHQIHQILVPVS